MRTYEITRAPRNPINDEEIVEVKGEYFNITNSLTVFGNKPAEPADPVFSIAPGQWIMIREKPETGTGEQ